jgi:hypothetical protein
MGALEGFGEEGQYFKLYPVSISSRAKLRSPISGSPARPSLTVQQPGWLPESQWL